MGAQLNAFSTDGQVILTFPEAAMKSEDREEFITFAKTEWLARQSRLALLPKNFAKKVFFLGGNLFASLGLLIKIGQNSP